MSTVRGFVSDEGKLKYRKDAIEVLAPIVHACKGKDVYVTIVPADEIDYQKDMVKYYMEWILPYVFTPMKSKGVKTIRQTHQCMLEMFAPPVSGVDNQITQQMSIPTPIEDMDLSQRVKFIADIAIWAEKTFGIHFKSVTEA